MAKSRKNRKSKGKSPQQVKLSPKAYIKKVARKLPVECKIISGWKDRGNTQVLVIRKRTNGQIIIGFYMVDSWCLGLKDTFYRHDIEPSEFEEMMASFEQQFSHGEEELIDCDPQLAFNLIYGAIEYAEDLGFAPAKDFAITEYILDDIDEIEYMDIEFGNEGKPFYASGPNDNVGRILSTLNDKVGEGNFNYMAHIDEDTEMFSPEYIKENPYSTRPEAYQRFEEFEKAEDDEAGVEYMFQLMAADKIHQMLGGDFDGLKEVDYEEFVEDVVASMEKTINAEEEKPIQDEERKSIVGVVESVIAQIRYYSNAEFLFNKDYQPIVKSLTWEQMQEMSQEEIEAFMQEIDRRSSPKELYKKHLRLFILNVIEEDLGFDTEQALTEEQKEQVKVKVEEKYQAIKDKNNEEYSDLEREFLAAALQESFEIIAAG